MSWGMRGGRRCGGIADLICIKTPSVQCRSHHPGPCERARERGGERARARGIEGWEKERDLSFCEAWEWESVSCHESPHIRHHSGVMGPKQLAPWSVLIFLSCSQCVCVRVCLCAGACEGLRRMKFLMFEFVERERDKWESRREERVWMILFPLTSSGVRLCNWLVFLHLRVRVHCTRVCSSLHYNVCISLVLVTSVGG